MRAGDPSDILELQALVYRYCRGVDRQDWDLVRSCYHRDGYDDHGPFQGGVDELIDWLRERHQSITFSHHFVGNVIVEFDAPDRARTEAYCITVQHVDPALGDALAIYDAIELQPGPDSVLESEARCRIVDHVERRAGEWSVAHRSVVFESVQVRSVPRPAFPAGWTVATRDDDDPSYRRRWGALGKGGAVAG